MDDAQIVDFTGHRNPAACALGHVYTGGEFHPGLKDEVIERNTKQGDPVRKFESQCGFSHDVESSVLKLCGSISAEADFGPISGHLEGHLTMANQSATTSLMKTFNLRGTHSVEMLKSVDWTTDDFVCNPAAQEYLVTKIIKGKSLDLLCTFTSSDKSTELQANGSLKIQIEALPISGEISAEFSQAMKKANVVFKATGKMVGGADIQAFDTVEQLNAVVKKFNEAPPDAGVIGAVITPLSHFKVLAIQGARQKRVMADIEYVRHCILRARILEKYIMCRKNLLDLGSNETIITFEGTVSRSIRTLQAKKVDLVVSLGGGSAVSVTDADRENEKYTVERFRNTPRGRAVGDLLEATLAAKAPVAHDSPRCVPVEPNVAYSIVAKHSNKCLDSKGAKDEDWNPIIQYRVHGGAHQRWTFKDSGDGKHFAIVCQGNQKVLDVSGAKLEASTPIIQYHRHGGGSQLFYFKDSGDGIHFLIVAKHSGMVLDVRRGSRDDCAELIQHSMLPNANNQLFRFMR